MDNTEQVVEIYSTPTCHFCHMAKDWFKANNVKFVDHDVHADLERRKEVVEMTGQMGVPVIKIEEEGQEPEIMVGFSEQLLSDKLGMGA
jgi:glutaredoxin